MWLSISTLPCPYVVVNHYYSLLCAGNVLGLVHGRKWKWLLERWTNRLGMCWETSEEGETWRSLVLYMVFSFVYGCYYWLPSSEHSGWDLRTCIAFSHLSVQLLCFHSVLYFKLRWDRLLCWISTAFSDSSLILALPQPLFVQRVWMLFTKAFQLPSPFFVHLWSVVCVSVSGADHISGEKQGRTIVFRVIGSKPHS